MDPYHDLLAYVCELHRLAQRKVSLEAVHVASRIKTKLDEARQSARRSSADEEQWLALEKPLMCFLDYMVETTFDRNLTRGWQKQRLAPEAGILNGDVAFFEQFLDPDLERAEASGAPLDSGLRIRLQFYYRCLLVGFQGMYHVDPVGADARANNLKLRELSQRKTRLQAALLSEGKLPPLAPRFTPAAYEGICTNALDLNPAPALWGMGAMLFLFVALFLGVTNWMYRQASDQLEDAVVALEASGKLELD